MLVRCLSGWRHLLPSLATWAQEPTYRRELTLVSCFLASCATPSDNFSTPIKKFNNSKKTRQHSLSISLALTEAKRKREKVAHYVRFTACCVPPCISAPPGDRAVMVLLAALLERTCKRWVRNWFTSLLASASIVVLYPCKYIMHSNQNE